MNIGWENIKREYLQAGGLLLTRRSQRLRRAGSSAPVTFTEKLNKIIAGKIKLFKIFILTYLYCLKSIS